MSGNIVAAVMEVAGIEGEPTRQPSRQPILFKPRSQGLTTLAVSIKTARLKSRKIGVKELRKCVWPRQMLDAAMFEYLQSAYDTTPVIKG